MRCSGLIHAWLSQQPKVNDIAAGIAMIIFGSGIAFFLGKPFIQPLAPQLPGIEFGCVEREPRLRSALKICPLFFVGVLAAFAMNWFFRARAGGSIVSAVGDKPDAARAMGISVWGVRTLSIMSGSFLAGLGGAYLSLFYPGSWTEMVSGGQGMIAVALVIFARWNPIQCLWASCFSVAPRPLDPPCRR